MHSMIFFTFAVAASIFAGSSYAAPSCSDTSDHFINGSSRNNTLNAGLDLMAFFNDPARSGVLSLPALGPVANYVVQRQVGWVHVSLAVADYTKSVAEEDIPLDSALNALLELITTCTRGSASIGKGQWHFSVAEENHVGKREYSSSIDVEMSPQELVPTTHDQNVKRVDKSLGNIGTLAAWPVLRLGLEDETRYFGNNIVSFSDSAENPLIDAVAKSATDQVRSNSGNANTISAGGANDFYQVKFTLTGFSNWGAAEKTITSHGDEETLFDKLTENTMHNIADRKTVMGRFKWELESPSGTNAGKAINVVIVRLLTSTPTQSESCKQCDCQVGNAKPQVSLPNDDEISEAPDDFPKDLPASVEEKQPPHPNIVLATGKRRSIAERRSRNNHSTRNLFKRYSSCSVLYDNNNYPSTAQSSQLPPNQNKADSIPEITKWIDWEIRQNPAVTQICDWYLAQESNRVARREYATEHVFEKHLIASFLKWSQKPFGLCVRANCAKINNVFNRVSQTANSPFTGQRPSAAMALALSDNTRRNEFFILRAEVNLAKTVILSNSLEFRGLPALYETDSWARTLQTIRTYSMGFNYMNAPVVSNIFKNTNNRMRAILAQIDGDNFYARPSTCDDGHGDQTSNSWQGLWDEWIGKFLAYKEIKMSDWISYNAVPLLRRQITSQVADIPTRTEMLADITYFQQAGNLMSGGAFSFDQVYHNLS